MILCIKKDELKISSELQKDVKLEEILLKHTKYFPSIQEAEKDGYYPLDFMVSIRSVYTNLVLESDVEDSDEKRYFINLTNVDVLPHKGLDLIMYLASVGVMHCVDYKLGFDEVMMKSHFSPIGLLNTEPTLLNPIIYSHIILDDEVVEKFETYLKPGFRFVPIKDIQQLGNMQTVTDSFVNVEKREEDEA